MHGETTKTGSPSPRKRYVGLGPQKRFPARIVPRTPLVPWSVGMHNPGAFGKTRRFALAYQQGGKYCPMYALQASEGLQGTDSGCSTYSMDL